MNRKLALPPLSPKALTSSETSKSAEVDDETKEQFVEPGSAPPIKIEDNPKSDAPHEYRIELMHPLTGVAPDGTQTMVVKMMLDPSGQHTMSWDADLKLATDGTILEAGSCNLYIYPTVTAHASGDKTRVKVRTACGCPHSGTDGEFAPHYCARISFMSLILYLGGGQGL